MGHERGDRNAPMICPIRRQNRTVPAIVAKSFGLVALLASKAARLTLYNVRATKSRKLRRNFMQAG
jgi:hypothetical protein